MLQKTINEDPKFKPAQMSHLAIEQLFEKLTSLARTEFSEEHYDYLILRLFEHSNDLNKLDPLNLFKIFKDR